MLGFLAKANEFVIPFEYQEQAFLKEEHMSVSLKGLGFKYMNCILNLGNAGQMLFLNCCFVGLFFLWYVRFMKTRLRKDYDNFSKYKKKMFFAPFLSMAFRLFIPLSISSYLNLQWSIEAGPLSNSNLIAKGLFGEIVANAYAYFIAFLVCVCFPCVMVYVMLVPKEWLLRPDFKARWGFLYNSIKTENFFQRAYFFMFVVRRAFLVYTGLLMYNYPGIQVQCTMGANVLLLIWAAVARSYKTKFDNKMELNTEMFLAIITYHLLCFTDFIPERGGGLAARVLMGKSFILWVGLLMAVNLYFVFKELGRLSKLKWVRKYRIWLKQHNPLRFKVQQEARDQEQVLDDEERDRTVRLREQALIKTRVAQLVSEIERDDEFLKPAEERKRRRSESKILYGERLRANKKAKAAKTRELTVIMDAGSEEDISDYEVDIFAPMEDPERFQEHLVKEMRAPEVP